MFSKRTSGRSGGVYRRGTFVHPSVTQDVIAGAVADLGIGVVTVTAGVDDRAAEPGRHCKEVWPELGRIDPFIGLADADLDRAVAAPVRSSFLDRGPVCDAAKRMWLRR